jgi:type IV pilus assembly protein PilA
MRRVQEGVTLIEMMIVVAIVGILSALALPAYTVYSIRAQIIEGLYLADGAKAAVTTYYRNNSVFPTDNDDAGLGMPESIVGTYVSSITVDGPVLGIRYGNEANSQIDGKVITLTATDMFGNLSWQCTNDGSIQPNHLPPLCR